MLGLTSRCFHTVLHASIKQKSLPPRPPGLQQDAEQDEGYAHVEGEIDFAPLAEDEEGEDDGVAGLEVVSEIDGEGRQPLQGLNLQEVHTNGAEQGMTKHKPEISTCRDNHHGLITWKEI